MYDKINLLYGITKATTHFGGRGYSSYADEQRVVCCLCGKPNVVLQGNQTLDQHLEFRGISICPASGKALPQAAKMRFDENYNLVGDDLIEEESE